jgi:hypothetical protein
MAKAEATTTEALLIAKYGVIIPLEVLRLDFFSHLSSVEKLRRKIMAGEIPIPMVDMVPSSQKSAKGSPTSDFAVYLDTRIEAARKECRQLSGAAS